MAARTEPFIISWLSTSPVPKPSNGIVAPLFSSVVVAMASPALLQILLLLLLLLLPLLCLSQFIAGIVCVQEKRDVCEMGTTLLGS
mgnify:CR=1 FL=1